MHCQRVQRAAHERPLAEARRYLPSRSLGGELTGSSAVAPPLRSPFFCAVTTHAQPRKLRRAACACAASPARAPPQGNALKRGGRGGRTVYVTYQLRDGHRASGTCESLGASPGPPRPARATGAGCSRTCWRGSTMWVTGSSLWINLSAGRIVDHAIGCLDHFLSW